MKKNYKIGSTEMLFYIKKLKILIFSIFFFSTLVTSIFYYYENKISNTFKVIIEAPFLEIFAYYETDTKQKDFKEILNEEKDFQTLINDYLKMEYKNKKNISNFQASLKESDNYPVLKFDFQKYSVDDDDRQFLIICINAKSQYDCEKYVRKFILFTISNTNKKILVYLQKNLEKKISNLMIQIDDTKITLNNNINTYYGKLDELKKLSDSLKMKSFTDYYKIGISSVQNKKLFNYIFTGLFVGLVLSIFSIFIFISKKYTK